MPKEDDATTDQPTKTEIKVLRANNVEIPLTGQAGQDDPEILKLRQAFFNGERLSPAELNKLMLRSMEGGGNGNCGIC